MNKDLVTEILKRRGYKLEDSKRGFTDKTAKCLSRRFRITPIKEGKMFKILMYADTLEEALQLTFPGSK